MQLTNITARLNEMLGGERHGYSKLVSHLDKTIDDINAKLNSTYPAFSELPAGASEYSYFPDRYIRSVVLPGAAWYYFTSDEEGIMTAQQYMDDYYRGLFYMLRDHFNYVPAEYQATELKALVFYGDLEDGERGITVDGTDILP